MANSNIVNGRIAKIENVLDEFIRVKKNTNKVFLGGDRSKYCLEKIYRG